jgi:hypothetical protein
MAAMIAKKIRELCSGWFVVPQGRAEAEAEHGGPRRWCNSSRSGSRSPAARTTTPRPPSLRLQGKVPQVAPGDRPRQHGLRAGGHQSARIATGPTARRESARHSFSRFPHGHAARETPERPSWKHPSKAFSIPIGASRPRPKNSRPSRGLHPAWQAPHPNRRAHRCHRPDQRKLAGRISGSRSWWAPAERGTAGRRQILQR